MMPPEMIGSPDPSSGDRRQTDSIPFVRWGKHGEWIQGRVLGICECEVGPIARLLVTRCSEGLKSTVQAEHQTKTVRIKPRGHVHVEAGDIDIQRRMPEFKGATRHRITFVCWVTAASGPKHRLISVRPLPDSLAVRSRRCRNRRRKDPSK